MRLLGAHYVPIMCRKAFGVKSVGSATPTMRLLGAHSAPPIGFTRLGAKSMGPRCGHYALIRRSLCAHYVSKNIGGESGGRPVRLLCAY